MWGNPQKQSKNAGSTDFRFLTSRPARGAEFSGISAPRAPEFSVLEGSRNSGPDRSPDLDFWAPGPATPRGQRLGGPRGPWTGFGPQNPKQGSLKLPSFRKMGVRGRKSPKIDPRDGGRRGAPVPCEDTWSALPKSTPPGARALRVGRRRPRGWPGKFRGGRGNFGGRRFRRSETIAGPVAACFT